MTITVVERLTDGELEQIYARWLSSPNSDSAVWWYSRDVGALLSEVIALRRWVAKHPEPKPEPEPVLEPSPKVVITKLPQNRVTES
jgi:hypothetical protein